MTLTLKFIGALRHAIGKDTYFLDCPQPLSMLELINELSKVAPQMRSSLLDEQLEEPKPNALILVNGKEISILKGLQTPIKDGDEIVFIPVVHGG
ncbi:MAG: MoaD/ThiS family protein [Candidatus Bathyarchaeota archaeon]|nr:MoaD/ThiS family protein [Candidatus Bathyarchaeota archaeon]